VAPESFGEIASKARFVDEKNLRRLLVNTLSITSGLRREVSRREDIQWGAGGKDT
jgi:hypothetical protein